MLRRLQAASRRGAAARLSERHALQARGGGVRVRQAPGLGHRAADGDPPGRAARHRQLAVVCRAALRRRRAVRSPARDASLRPAADGAVRPADQQRRPQGRPLPARRARTGVGHRPRTDVPSRAEAAHGHLGLLRRSASARARGRARSAFAATRRGRRRCGKRCSRCMSEQEIDALFDRWDRLLAVPCYPQLDPYRNVPWPPF